LGDFLDLVGGLDSGLDLFHPWEVVADCLDPGVLVSNLSPTTSHKSKTSNLDLRRVMLPRDGETREDSEDDNGYHEPLEHLRELSPAIRYCERSLETLPERPGGLITSLATHRLRLSVMRQ